MKRVYKYAVPNPGEREKVIAPATQTLVLDVAFQGNQLYMWLLVDPKAPLSEWDLMTVGTGWDLPDSVSHLGTAHDGGFVWHLFEVFE